MAMVVVSSSWWFLDMGFGQALIQKKDLREEHKSTAFWSNVSAGLIIFVLLTLASPLAAAFFKAEDVTLVLVAMSFSVVLQSPEATLSALFQREFQFRALALRQIGSIVLGGTVGIAMALKGFGVWALVGDALVRGLASSALLFIQLRWRPQFLFHKASFLELWRFSKHMVGARIVNYFDRNIDTLLVGRYLGAASLGLYNLGYQFVLLPLNYLSRAVYNVLYPTLAQLQNENKRFTNAYLTALQLVCSTTFPLMSLIALAAPSLIAGFLGDKWSDAIPIIPFMCVAGALQSTQSLLPAVFQAKGDASYVLKCVSVSALATATAVAIGLHWGLKGIAVAYMLMNIVVTAALSRFLQLYLQIPSIVFLKVFTIPVAATALLVVTWYGLGHFLDLLLYYRLIFFLIIKAIAGLLVYIAVSLKWNTVVRDSLQRLKMSP
ncbi:MAG: lipopolysaccharide biosynthesis protein [Thermodesulfovibrionales bacterium]